jgi:hypothetical protein
VLGPLLLVGLSALFRPQGIFAVSAALLVVAIVMTLTVLREPRHLAPRPEDVDWQVSNQRALAAQAALNGLIVQAVDARELRRS